VAYDIDSNFYNGSVEPNYRLQFNANVTVADLAQTYAPGFRALIEEADVQTIMCRCVER
jgi:beta-glucosidase-like glycosyl hydrolase